MPPLLAALAAMLLAAEPAQSGPLFAQAMPRDMALGSAPSEQLSDATLNALPPPPETVVRQTRYYGTVTIDHRAHLARRSPCVGCHGPGPVSKLEFTPKIAHERCLGCHRQEARGPTDCRGCHVKHDPAPEAPAPASAKPQLAAVGDARSTVVASAAPAPPRVGAPVAASSASASSASASSAPTESFSARPAADPMRRVIHLGLVAGRGQGFAARAMTYLDGGVVAFGVDRMTFGRGSRTLGFVGGGISEPIRAGTWVEALALGGFDAAEQPRLELSPAVGARIGLGWRPRLRFLPEVHASVSTAMHVSSRTGDDFRRMTIYGALSTGFAFPSR